MKILITGGCGFIGKTLTKRFLDKGYEVDIIDNLYIGKEAEIVEGANFLGGDIRAMGNIPNKHYDCIYHLAAYSRVLPSYKNQNITYSVNVTGTKEVLDYALRNNCKVIFSSSSSIHHSISPYSTSKRMGEELCRFYRDGLKMDITIVRLYNVYGPGELVESHMAALIGKWRNQIKNKKHITIHQLGMPHRAFTHIDDVVDGLEILLTTKKKNLSGWEMGNTKSYSIIQIFKMFEEKFGKLKVRYAASVLGNYKNGKRLNNDVEKLNWHPKDKLKEYINSL